MAFFSTSYIILGEIPRSLDLYVYLDSFQLTYKNKKHMIIGFSNCYFQVNKPRKSPQINFIKNYLHLKPSFKVVCAGYQKPQAPEREKWRGAGYVTARAGTQRGFSKACPQSLWPHNTASGPPILQVKAIHPRTQEKQRTRDTLISRRRFPTFIVTQTTSKKVNNYQKPPLQSCWA